MQDEILVLRFSNQVCCCSLYVSETAIWSSNQNIYKYIYTHTHTHTHTHIITYLVLTLPGT